MAILNAQTSLEKLTWQRQLLFQPEFHGQLLCPTRKFILINSRVVIRNSLNISVGKKTDGKGILVKETAVFTYYDPGVKI